MSHLDDGDVLKEKYKGRWNWHYMGKARFVHNHCGWFPSSKSINSLFVCFLSGITLWKAKQTNLKFSVNLIIKSVHTHLSKIRQNILNKKIIHVPSLCSTGYFLFLFIYFIPSTSDTSEYNWSCSNYKDLISLLETQGLYDCKKWDTVRQPNHDTMDWKF